MVGPPTESSIVLEELAMTESRLGAERPSAERAPSAAPSGIQTASTTGCLVRLFWMGPGNLALFYFAGIISRLPSWTLTWRDVAFWSAVAALIGARYFDVARFEGLTAQGEPATVRHFRRYAVWTILIALAFWLSAQSVQT
jgi:hypothetical protein